MKFTVENFIKRAPRIGQLHQLKGSADIHLETPFAVLHTQAGHIPHITHEVFKLISKEPHILQIPLMSIHNYSDVMQIYNGDIAEFIGNKDSLTYITLNDPSNITKQGHHVKEKVPVFTKSGKVMYDSKKYMSLIENLNPDIYCLLSDGDTNIASAQKRVMKSVENTVKFNEQCISYHKQSLLLKDAFVIAPIAGGYCSKSRQKCLELILPNNKYVQGYLIDGLHNNGPEVEFLPFKDVSHIIEEVIDKLPIEKLRAVSGCWSPLNIIKLVNCGIDLFDTSYCRILTERSAALTFSIDENEAYEGYEINLCHEQYVGDFKPLLSGCKCVTCSGYTRGYIHHLVTVQELLGSVLIMIHNIHHMLRFFKKIRDCIKYGNLPSLENRITLQYNEYQPTVLQNT